MSKPAPRQNFMQSILFALVIFMGFQLFMSNKQSDPKTDALKSADVMKMIEADNAEIKDATLAHADLPLLQAKLKDEVQKKLITQDAANQLEYRGEVLLADTQLKASILRTSRNDPNGEGGLLQAAYYGFRNIEKKYQGKPIFTDQVIPVADVSQNKLFGWKSWKGTDLYNEITTRLDKKFHTDLLLGFVPGYDVVDTLVALSGRNPGFSYALAAFLLALIVRAIVYPLSQKQLMWSRQMAQLQPMVKEIKKQYSKEVKDPRTGKKSEVVTDQQALQMKTMELYKEYGINPLAGCGPAVIQMPLFLVVYQCMLHYQFTFQKGTFLWMNPGAAKLSNGFFGANLGQQDYLMILFYGITMVFSTLLTPVTDPSQARQQRMMGVGMALLFTAMMFFGFFPVPGAFVLYWTFTNLLSMAQSIRAYRLPVPPLVKVNAPGGGVYPTAGSAPKKRMTFMERMQDEMRQKYEAAQAGKETNVEPTSTNGKSNMNGSSNGQPKKNKSSGQPKHKPKKRQPDQQQQPKGSQADGDGDE